ncbi:AAA family ATPase [Ideonella sp. DXS22W]|uniref:AAA family ATPase n=1 Tax=Pseudaquabacterium inlustre TaxID=2984192 RepID=A0ABU9CGA1_9BURK
MLERHDAALLALLVLDGPQARQDVAALLWPAVPQAKALSSLRQRLYRLRRVVGHALVSEDGALQLADGVAHDLHATAELVGASASPSEFLLLAGHHHPPGEALSERLLALRERWLQARVAALEARADTLEGEGELTAALDIAQRLRAAQPASERAVRRCMRLLYLLGDRGQALAEYERCRVHLRTHLGLAPDDDTEQLARLVESARLPGRAPAGALTPAVALLRPPRLVGRDAVWARLQAAAHARLPVLVRGEPGIGKSRLVGDFGRSHARALVLRPAPEARHLPYSLALAWLEAWRALGLAVPEPAEAIQSLALVAPPQWGWGPAAPGAEQPRRLAQALAALLAPWARRSDACLVVDDLQWADDPSLALLLAWLDLAGTAGLPPVVLAVRSQSVPPVLSRWLLARQGAMNADAQAARSDRAGATASPTSATAPVPTPAVAASVLDLHLGPLDAAGLADLLASLQQGTAQAPAAEVQSLLRRTGGHPYIVLEMLRQGPGARVPQARGAREAGVAAAADAAAGLDARLRALLVRRVGHLPPLAQRLLQVLALAGGDVPDGVALQACGLDGPDLAEARRQLAAAQVLDDDGRAFDVVAEAVQTDLPTALAVRLHQRLAQALADAAAPPERVALHWAAAACFAQAAQAYRAAAQAAHLRGRLQQALAFHDAAAAAAAQAGEPEAQWTDLHCGLAVALLLDTDQGLHQRITSLAALARHDQQHLLIAQAQARAAINASDADAALPVAERALVLARQLSDAAAELRAAGWLGLARVLNGRVAPGLALLRGMLGRIEAVADPRARLDFFGAHGYALHQAGDYAGALQAFEQTLRLAESLGELGEALEQANNRMVCLGSLGQRDEALRAGEHMLVLWQRLGRPESVSAMSGMVQLAALYAARGRFAEAIERLQSALAVWRQSGPAGWRIITEHRLAVVYLRLGQHTRALQVLTPLGDDDDAGRAAMRVMVACRIAHQRGDAVLPRLRQALADFGPRLSAMDRRALHLLLAAHLPADDGLALSAQVAEEALAASDLPARRHALARQAHCCARLGQHEYARALAAEAWGPGGEPALLDLDHSSYCWLVHETAAAVGDAALAAAAQAEGCRWIRAALPHVPEAFRDSFLHRNPVHRSLMLGVPVEG